jgi:uncharacterized membrane protein YfcA
MLGALVPERRRRLATGTRAQARWTAVLPYVPVLVAGSLTGYRLLRGARIDAFLGELIFLLIVLVIVRQLMAVLENLGLARELESKVRGAPPSWPTGSATSARWCRTAPT